MISDILKMKHLRTLMLALCMTLAGGTALVGCDRQGPAEEAGENIDDAVDDAGDAVEDTFD